MNYFYAVFFVFLSCCGNVIFLEFLSKADSGSGNLITFCQFLFISIEGFIFYAKCGKNLKTVIPLNSYFILVTLFFLVSVSNNYALNFKLSLPLHMIFKSGSLVANLLLGIVILKRKYPLKKYISVAFITVGIFLCTIASAPKSNLLKESSTDILSWLFGLCLLTFSLLTSAWMGIIQETIHKEYGKNPREALFYCHVLPLPGFLLFAPNILEHFSIITNSGTFDFPILNLLPKLVWILIGNVITQYVCIRSVFTLTSEYTSLTVTLVVTLRKFASVLLSILIFQNAFTSQHWLGTGFVFFGSLMFLDILDLGWSYVKSLILPQKPKTH